MNGKKQYRRSRQDSGYYDRCFIAHINIRNGLVCKKGYEMVQFIKKAILAGILVGIGVIGNSSVENRYIGAMLFSVALLAILKCELNLYTGKCGFYWLQKPKDLAIMLFFNLLGVLVPTLAVAACRKEVYGIVVDVSAVKFGQTWTELFLYGMLCGVLMFVAAYAKDTVITVFCIMTFILSGYEHCIADFIYLILNFSAENLIKFAGILRGNSVGALGSGFLVSDS